MQVSHQNDHITHAVIGGKQAIEFGISNSAEFFNILSSTLYKDQILAVVREVLCNAWDAHIEAGCTDRPIQVSLTDDMFTIKDFGKGIHQDDMGLIYGTYGNSTKKNDGMQTGGFGLGCKAPFAYTDHFEVVSCHAGIRTIYNLSKSSAQAMGKPGITPIASFPTTDSGLTVNIRIKNIDIPRFSNLITRISHNGDMNVTFNGKQVSTLNFDVSKNNFLITYERPLDNWTTVMVRYGNVIYPVDCSQSLKGYTEIENHLAKLKRYGSYCAIVFQAPPHSIAVTPSRESLSMQDHTINTLNTLFQGFLASLENEFREACMQYTEKSVQCAVTEKRMDLLLKRDASLPRTGKPPTPSTLSDFNQMAEMFLEFNYPNDLEFRKKDVATRLNLMVQNSLLDRGKVQSFLRELNHVQSTPSSKGQWYPRYEDNSWLQRRVIAPLVTKLSQEGLDPTKLYSCNTEDRNWNRHNNSFAPLVQATKAKPDHLLVTLPYLRNIVVLATRQKDLIHDAYRHEAFQPNGNYQGFLVYISGRKKGELEAARQFFAKEGMVVADLTLNDEKEEEFVVRTTPRKPAKKGVAALSSVASSGETINIHLFQQESAKRIDAPEFILQVSLKTNVSNCLHNWSPKSSRAIIKLFGDKGGITNNTATYDKWVNKGVKPFKDYVRSKICSYILDNPRIAAHQANNISRMKGKSSVHTLLMRVMCNNLVFSKEFGLSKSLDKEDEIYLSLWEEMMQRHYEFSSPETTKVRDWLNAIPLNPAIVDLGKKMNSSILDLIDIGEFRRKLENAGTQSSECLLTFFKTVLTLKV
jgi:hypothetical protein